MRQEVRYRTRGLKWHVSLVLSVLFCFPVMAQDDPNDDGSYSKQRTQVVTGWSGGMMIHAGYGFSKSPDELFRNGSIKDDISAIGDLPTRGAFVGIGGQGRIHLFDHIHLGAEGHMSLMPLMKSGSQVRSGWGGVLCDYYGTIGRVSPLIGMSVGGGSMQRIFVPNTETVNDTVGLTYNASYSKTSFFYLDPYVGLEIRVKPYMAILLRVDYMLPFGKKNGLSSETVKWSNFLTPSGPRLYIGFLFGNN